MDIEVLANLFILFVCGYTFGYYVGKGVMNNYGK